jgi:sulfur-carrier protein
MPRVFIPPAMRSLVNGQDIVEANGRTVLQMICDVDRRFPGFKDQICNGDSLRPGLAVSIDGSASYLGTSQPVSENSEIHFLPAVGGG